MNRPKLIRLWKNVTTWWNATYSWLNRFAESPKGRWTGKLLSYLIQAGIIIYLLYELTIIGWDNFFSALPLTPFFYLLFLVIYSALPIAEIFCYKQSWQIGFWESLPTFIKKRVYNKTLFGYSGEIAVFGWYRKKRAATSDKEILKVIRDNNIMSALASTTVVFGLLIYFVLSERIALMDYLANQYDLVTILGSLLMAVLLGFVAYKIRRYFFSMSARVALTIFAIHAFRMMLITTIQVLQWYVVMPEVALNTWFTFLSIQLLVSRIPFLPSRDLFYIGASLEVSNLINFSSAGIAGLLVAQNVLDKLLNVALFGLISIRESGKPQVLSQPENSSTE